MQMTIEQALQLGLQHHQAGRLPQAEELYRQVHAADPGNPDALHLLGVIAQQSGRHELAVELITRAIVIRPIAEFHYNRGESYRALQRTFEAIADFRAAIAYRSDYAEAHNNLGIALNASGRSTEAVDVVRRAIQLNERMPQAHTNLGAALQSLERYDEAAAALTKAVALDGNSAEAHYNLGSALLSLGRLDEAIAALERATQLNPWFFQAFLNLSRALEMRGRADEAVNAAHRAVALRSDSADAYRNLGIALQRKVQLTEAAAAYEQGLAIRRHDSQLLSSLGVIQVTQARAAEAIGTFRRAIHANPNDSVAHSNLLLAMHYVPISADEVFREHQRWAEQHAKRHAGELAQHGNSPDDARRLRIGYLSPDFRQHPVAQFLEPLLMAHDREAFEIFAYNDLAGGDATTARLRAHVDHWREVFALSHEKLTALIRTDAIDILIDLAGHSARNRMLVFARKPAPVQMSYLGYPDTTGLKTVDYRLSDAASDPPGESEGFYTERLVRLPRAAWCYQPLAEAPEVAPLPALANQHVTFGSFNRLAKVSPETIDLWAQVLSATPGSKLILKARALADEPTARQVLAWFTERHIESERIELRGNVRGIEEHMRHYNDIDIALDTFPYHGTTTTCDALWMGVPVVTLAGDRHVSRVGASLLSAVKLKKLVAKTPRSFVRIAAGLAEDRDELTKLRTGLRERMRGSPLCDAASFARDVETIYRDIWRQWCEQR